MNGDKKIPQHIAIIMDGNGRWAKERGKERVEGHFKGVDAIRKTIRAASNIGVEYLTLYAFSTENWGRPSAEVDALMELVCMSVASETPELKKQGIKVTIIGDKSRFSLKVQESLAYIEGQTAMGEGLNMVLALNYSSRDELRRAVTQVAQKVKCGELDPDSITEETIAKELDTRNMPDPDLIIRTSGECRLSNFLLWQASYAEFYFPDVLWPDFDSEWLDQAVEEYNRRERRYGKL
ncbi:MAG: isoprenyl transferase [Rikenellaceae bacterium]